MSSLTRLAWVHIQLQEEVECEADGVWLVDLKGVKAYTCFTW